MNVLHPPFSGFPFVLMSIIVGAEIFSFFLDRKKCQEFAWIAWWILAGTLPITYFSGYFGSEYASNSFTVSQEVIANHQAMAKLFIISVIPCILLAAVRRDPANQKPGLHSIYQVFLLLAYLLVIITSSKGGKLVFEHGAGVAAPIAQLNADRGASDE